MSISWLQPLAWWGLAALAIPLLIHLLVRQRSRRVPFPTLRFLRATRLSALRSRVISDWLLLVVRTAILAAAVTALAGPLFVSAERRQSWNTRVARAIVVAPPASSGAAMEMARAVAQEQQNAFRSVLFETRDVTASVPGATVADRIRDAASWFEEQPPAVRELVIAGDLREGALTESDLAHLGGAGVRFAPFAGAEQSATLALPSVSAASGRTARSRDIQVDADAAETRVRYAESNADLSDRLVVRAAPADQAYADALGRAVLAEGITFGPHRDRRVLIAFADAAEADVSRLIQPPRELWMREALERVPDLRGGQRDSTLIVVADMSVGDTHAARLIARTARAVFANDLPRFEPRRISAATLAAWTRSPLPSPEDAPTTDEGDRRWLWAAALVLLGIEQVLRRARTATQPAAPSQAIDEEARVA